MPDRSRHDNMMHSLSQFNHLHILLCNGYVQFPAGMQTCHS